MEVKQMALRNVWDKPRGAVRRAFGRVDRRGKKCYSVSAEGIRTKLVWAKSISEVERRIGATRNILDIKVCKKRR